MTAPLSNKPSLAEVLDLALRGALGRVRVAMPGRVTSYSHTTQRASVQPLIQDRYARGGEIIAESLPELDDVPVEFEGAGGFHSTFPLAKGDTLMLVFYSSSIAN